MGPCQQLIEPHGPHLDVVPCRPFGLPFSASSQMDPCTHGCHDVPWVGGWCCQGTKCYGPQNTVQLCWVPCLGLFQHSMAVMLSHACPQAWGWAKTMDNSASLETPECVCWGHLSWNEVPWLAWWGASSSECFIFFLCKQFTSLASLPSSEAGTSEHHICLIVCVAALLDLKHTCNPDRRQAGLAREMWGGGQQSCKWDGMWCAHISKKPLEITKSNKKCLGSRVVWLHGCEVFHLFDNTPCRDTHSSSLPLPVWHCLCPSPQALVGGAIVVTRVSFNICHHHHHLPQNSLPSPLSGNATAGISQKRS